MQMGRYMSVTAVDSAGPSRFCRIGRVAERGVSIPPVCPLTRKYLDHRCNHRNSVSEHAPRSSLESTPIAPARGRHGVRARPGSAAWGLSLYRTGACCALRRRSVRSACVSPACPIYSIYVAANTGANTRLKLAPAVEMSGLPFQGRRGPYADAAAPHSAEHSERGPSLLPPHARPFARCTYPTRPLL